MLADYESRVLRPLIWLGDSKKNIQAFPVGVRKIIGDELQLIQFGGMPKDAKPFKGIGSGVVEIALRHDANEYRAVLAIQLWRQDIRPACLSEESQVRDQDASAGYSPDSATI